ncbi:Protein spire like [Forsythia ovata]|uniref:Protein spire like n=1 Tax=Forsythia ovata TaxID=205694 RepID=A0ABD1SM75_9LAMI
MSQTLFTGTDISKNCRPSENFGALISYHNFNQMSFHYFILIKCFALTAAITKLKGEAAVIPSGRRPRKKKELKRSVYIASPELNRHYAFVPTVTGYLISPLTTSRRVADRKVGKFEKNITKHGIVPEASTKKGNNYPVGPVRSLIEDIKDVRFHKIGTGLEIISKERTYALRLAHNAIPEISNKIAMQIEEFGHDLKVNVS